MVSKAALTFWYTSLRASDCEKALLACLKIIAVTRISIDAKATATMSSIRVKAEFLCKIDNLRITICDLRFKITELLLLIFN